MVISRISAVHNNYNASTVKNQNKIQNFGASSTVVKNVAEEAKEQAPKLFTRIKDGIVKIANSVAEFFKNIFNSCKEAFGKLFKHTEKAPTEV